MMGILGNLFCECDFGGTSYGLFLPTKRLQRKFSLMNRRFKGLFISFYAQFDFAGRYMRRFLSEDLPSTNAQIFTLFKHDTMICYEQLLFQGYWVKIAFRVIHGQVIFKIEKSFTQSLTPAIR